MRSKWEEPAGEDLDAPASLTIREVRALRRRAGIGVLGVLLALLAVAGLGWTLFTGPEGLAQIQDLKTRVLPVAATESPVEPAPVEPARNEPAAPAPAPSNGAATPGAPGADSTSVPPTRG